MNVQKPHKNKRFRENTPEGEIVKFKKYILLRCTEEGKTLKEVSPFKLFKCMQSCIGSTVTSCKKLRDGQLLIEVENADQSHALLKLTELAGLKVEAQPHKVLNYCKGVVSCFDLLHATDEECKSELAAQGVIDCYRLKNRQNKPSISLVLTFDMEKLPEKINVGFNKCAVRPFFPTPMRCFKCQKFGHTAAKCPADPVCPRCGLAAHEEECKSSMSCVNCSGNHPSFSKDCPVMLQEKKIVEIRVLEKISYFEAKQKFKELAPPTLSRSYASVAKKQSSTIATQTCELSPLESTGLRTITARPVAVTSLSTAAAGAVLPVAVADATASLAAASAAAPAAKKAATKSPENPSGDIEKMEVVVDPPPSAPSKELRRPSLGVKDASKKNAAGRGTRSTGTSPERLKGRGGPPIHFDVK